MRRIGNHASIVVDWRRSVLLSQNSTSQNDSTVKQFWPRWSKLIENLPRQYWPMIKTCRKADWNVSLNLTWNWTNSWITYITLHLTNNTSAYMRVKRIRLRGWWFYRVFANNIILVFFWNVYVFVCLLGGEKNMAETLVGKLRRKSNRTLALNVPRPPRPADALFLMLTHSRAPLKYPFPQQLINVFNI